MSTFDESEVPVTFGGTLEEFAEEQGPGFEIVEPHDAKNGTDVFYPREVRFGSIVVATLPTSVESTGCHVYRERLKRAKALQQRTGTASSENK